MPLTFQLRQASSIPIEVDSIQLETVKTQSLDEVRATLVQRGNRQHPLNDFFEVTGSAEDNELVFVGDCSKVKLIGTKLSSGRIRVEGHAGMHLGAEMTGGEILVTGNVADWVGAEMHGGKIEVRGHAGHLVGAVYRGGFKGMTGGEIIIHGDAGNEIGHGMRRGLIAIGGKSGDVPGVNMIAGTILLFGEAGIRPAPNLKRGTIAYFDGMSAPEVLPSFKFAGEVQQPTWLAIYLRHLKQQHFPLPEGIFEASYRCYRGDFLELGKGEVLVRCA